MCVEEEEKGMRKDKKLMKTVVVVCEFPKV